MFGWEDPLFWVHLNVDYPFNLKGILYFPKLRNDFGKYEGQVKLFAGQVFVADNVKEVIPEFLTLLKGVIDCPDLPLNVSRSFLQNDGTVKKLSAHITKKVADKLCGLFNTERETYQKYWDDIAPFVKFGAMRDQKFYEQVKKAILYKTTDGRYLTLEEYKTANADKADKKVYYTNDPKRQAASVALYTNRGIDVVVMDHIIDGNFQSFMEYSGGEEGLTFARVDADVSGLLEDSEEGKELNQETIQAMFRKALGKDDLPVNLQSLSDAELPAMVTEDEQIRRMKEMSRLVWSVLRHARPLHARAEPPQQGDSGTGGARPGERDDAAALPADLRFGAYERPAAGSGRDYGVPEAEPEARRHGGGEGISETNPQFNRKRPTRGKPAPGAF